jgi:hypothetical protein
MDSAAGAVECMLLFTSNMLEPSSFQSYICTYRALLIFLRIALRFHKSTERRGGTLTYRPGIQNINKVITIDVDTTMVRAQYYVRDMVQTAADQKHLNTLTL